MRILEAKCERCGQLFCPNDENDLIHVWDEAKGTDCGGQGTIIGVWTDENLRNPR